MKGEANGGVAEVALQYCDSYNELILSFANNVHTPEGGTHEEGLKTALTRVFNEFGRAKGYLKEKDENWQGSDVREGMIAEYLEALLPEDWDSMDISERRAFLRGDMLTAGNRVGKVKRTAVSAVEVWAECFGRDPATIKRADTYDIFMSMPKMS